MVLSCILCLLKVWLEEVSLRWVEMLVIEVLVNIEMWRTFSFISRLIICCLLVAVLCLVWKGCENE